MPLICPTGQVALSNAGGRLLLCMGLFSIFGSAHLEGKFSNVTRRMADLQMNIPRVPDSIILQLHLRRRWSNDSAPDW
jgi:UV DNA damage repair endonuclease